MMTITEVMYLKSNSIPESWVEERLGDLVLYEKGKKPKTLSKQQSNEYKYAYINIKGFEQGLFDEYSDGKSGVICSEDDFLLVWDGARSGLVGKGMKGLVGSTLVKINFPGIYNEYAYYYLKSKYYEINTNAKGTGIPHVNPDLLWNYRFPIPPIQEQHRIVEKIEELFSEIDKGIEYLQTAKEQLEVYRQAVLKAAFEGKLTKEWREKKTDLPFADDLLEKIKKERIKYYENQLQEWEKAVSEWENKSKKGKKPRKPNKIKELPPFSTREITQLTKIPTEWKWVKIDMIQGYEQYSLKAGPFGSSLKKSCYVKSGFKIYGQEQVIAGDWKIGDYYIDQNKYEELKSCSVQPNDVLISLVGTVGKVLVLPDEIEPGIINPRLIKISLAEDFYLPKFFKYYFESAYLKSIYTKKSHGATMDIINLGIIQELPFPLLSKEEQHQIVQEIESRLSVCDYIEETVEKGLAQAEALKQSILKKAFEGRLVPQDPDDEPAAVLLERIRAEKRKQDEATTAATKKTKKGKKKHE